MKMRKYVFIVLSVALTMWLTGCKTKTADLDKADTLDVTVLHDEWQFDEEAMQFYYHCSVPQITPQVYNYGNWSLSREYNKGYKDAYQVTLPTSSFMTDTLKDNSVVYYTQYIDYRLGVGYVEIQLTNSDYFYAYDEKGKIIKPDDMYFRLQLIY